MKYLSAALAAGVSVLAGGVSAAEDRKLYVTAKYGLDLQSDEAIRGANVAGAPRNIDIEFDNGRYASAAIGYIAADGAMGRLRFEVEAAYHESDVEQLSLNDVERAFRAGSNVSATTGMINAYYDTPLIADRFRIFGGGGFGIGSIDHEVRYLVERPEEAGGNLAIAIPSTETTFSYQFGGGLEAVITPRISLVGDVRYVGFGDTQVERFVLTTGAIDSVLDADKSSVVASGGVRFTF
ncbi:MAG: outer membrane beta-barrel protein [Pseudomonadota bacterium]